MYALSIYKSVPELFSILTIICTCIYGEMGRGRNNGPIDQSTKKPKVRKNKEKVDWPVFQPQRIEKNTELPIPVSEGLLAEMKKMSPQELMNILLPDNVNRDISYLYI